MTRTTEPSWVILYQDNKTEGLMNHPQTSNQGKLVIDPKKGEFCKKHPSFGTHDWPKQKFNLGQSYVVCGIIRYAGGSRDACLSFC